MALLETGDWGNAGGDAKVDLKAERFGAEPPASLVDLVGCIQPGDLRDLRIQQRPMGRIFVGRSQGSLEISLIRGTRSAGAAGGK